jgi:hypothetical protein
MSTGPSQEVQVDILPPVPKDTAGEASTTVQLPPVPFPKLRTFYHPASGVVILGLDWIAFGSDLLTDLIALPLICIISFLMTFPIVYVIQMRWGRDSHMAALGKAFLGAFMVGLPFPITGTLLGAAILALAGLPHHPVDMVKKLATQSAPQK